MCASAQGQAPHPVPVEPPPPPLRADRQAMLVIHGIGEQNPYETLDSFARGVFTHFTQTRGKNAKLCPIAIAHKDWTQIGMRIGFYPPDVVPPPCSSPGSPDADGAQELASEDPPQYIDIYEYYWTPETEDKLSAVQTLQWVLKTDFTPLRYFADDLQIQRSLPGATTTGAVLGALRVLARELGRVFLYYVPLMLGIGLLLAWLSKDRSWSGALKAIAPELLKFLTPAHAGILLVYLAGLLMVWFAAQAFVEWIRRPGNNIDRVSDRTWLVCNVLLATVFLAAALWLDFHFRIYAGYDALAGIFGSGRWQAIVGAGTATVVSYALIAYVADVAVYTDMDAKSKNHATRNSILAGSTAMLRVLLTCDDYQRVILAGHSLGSVIAYDSINDLLDQRNAWPGPPWDTPNPFLSLADLQKLKGLVTFGSPLDRIFYFFREHVKRDQAIRAQVLAMLHSFRRVGAGRDYDSFRFNYSFNQLDAGPDPIVWLNAWATTDPVSSRLRFYRPNDQQRFPYKMPVLAHLSYWGDQNFYDYFCRRLL